MREHKNLSGVYKIRNKINNKVYIGKTKCFYKRHCQYVSDVRNKTKGRVNDCLMNSFIKYGFDNFEFTVVEFCDVELCTERELFWILYYSSLDKSIGYNFRLDSSAGMVTHPDTVAKMSENLKKQWADGVREGHSEKLKLSWDNRDRKMQSDQFSKTLTKWLYIINYPDGSVEEVLYKQLKEKGYKNSINSFSRKKF